MRKYLFYLSGFLLVLISFAFSNKVFAANPDCINGFCVDTEVVCGVHSAIIQDYITPGLAGSDNVTCQETRGVLGDGAYNYSITNQPGELWVYNSIRCTGSGPIEGLTIYDSSACYIKTGDVEARIDGPDRISSSTPNVNFTFKAEYDNLSLDSGANINYRFLGDGLVPSTEGTVRGSKVEVKRPGGCPTSPTDCKYRGLNCCLNGNCSDPVCYQSGIQYFCYNYSTSRYDGMGNCSLTCDRTYTLTSIATSFDYLYSKTFRKDVYYDCPPPSPINGICGLADRTYAYNQTSFIGSFCSSGTSSPQSPSFPNQGQTTTWDCLGSNGGSSSNCSAIRESDSPSPPSIPDLYGSCDTNGTVSVDWSAPSEATSYNFRFIGEPTPPNLIVEDGYTSNSYTYDGDPGKTYRTWVHACNSSGCSGAQSPNLTINCPLTPPPPGPVTISGRVTRSDTGNGIKNAEIELCSATAETDSSGYYSANVSEGDGYCSRIDGGLPADYTAIKGTNNRSCHQDNPTYEWQVAGQNAYVSCSSSDSGSWDRSSDSNVNFVVDYSAPTPPTPPPPSGPTLTLTASPNPISYNSSSILTWVPNNASSCWASGDWDGWKTNTGGNQGTGNLKANKTYEMECWNEDGVSSGRKSVTVGVLPLPINGQCGPADKTYKCNKTSFEGDLCDQGDPDPSSPIFPDKGATTPWTCTGRNGGTDAPCSATREDCQGDSWIETQIYR